MIEFAIFCKKCGSENVEIQPYEDKTVIECKDCSQTKIIVVIEEV